MSHDADFDDADWLVKLREVMTESAVQQLRLIYGLKERAGDYARGSAGYRSPLWDAAWKKEGSEMLYDLARLSTRTYEQWLKIGSRHFDFIVDSLLGPRHKHGQPSHAPGHIVLKAQGAVGGHAASRFCLKNPQAVRAPVRFTMPLLRSHSGRRLHGEIVFERVDCVSIPEGGDDLVLGPSEEGRFEAVISIPKDTESGCYRGDAYVIVGGRVAGQLCFEIDVTQAQPMLQVTANGQPGEQVLTEPPFAVKNPLGNPAVASISTPVAFHSEVLGDFAADVKLDATGNDTPLLAPGQSATFKVSITIPNALPIPAGKKPVRYSGSACVLVGAQLVLQLAITLDVQ